MTTDKPLRNIEIGIRIGADDRPAMLKSLSNILQELKRGEGDCVVSGGYDSHYTVRVAERGPTGIDHDEYFRQVDEWIEANQS